MADQIPDWLVPQLQEAIQYKLTDGTRPMDPARRVEVLAMIMRAVDSVLSAPVQLPITPPGIPDWVLATVQKAMAYGITDGQALDQPAPRMQLFALAVRAWACTKGVNMPSAADEVAVAQQQGLTDGTRPQDIATRGEAMAIALRLYKQVHPVAGVPGMPDFGPPTSRSQRYDRKEIVWANQHPAFVDLATGALNRSECEQIINSRFPGLVDCMRPTLDSEGYDWLRNTAGNFDGAGLSIGCVQWNIGQGTLQPLLRTMGSKYPDVWAKVFRDGRADALAANMDSLQWVISNVCAVDGQHMTKDWGIDWDMLCATAEFQAIQLDYTQQGYWGEAMDLAKSWGVTTKKGLAAVFNAHVQMGWFATSTSQAWSLRSLKQWELESLVSRSTYGNDGAKFLETVRKTVYTWPDDKKIGAFQRVFGEQADPVWKANVMGRFDKILADNSITYDPWQ